MVKGYKNFQTKFHTVFFFQLQQSDILQVCIQSSLLMQYAFSHSLIKVHSLVYWLIFLLLGWFLPNFHLFGLGGFLVKKLFALHFLCLSWLLSLYVHQKRLSTQLYKNQFSSNVSILWQARGRLFGLSMKLIATILCANIGFLFLSKYRWNILYTLSNLVQRIILSFHL